MGHHTLRAVLVVVCLASPLPLLADPVWEDVTPAYRPEGRFGHSFAFMDDPGWSRLPATVSPAARAGAGVVFDTARDRLILFGGGACSLPVSYGDTWEWDGTQWSERTPATGPPDRWNPALAYDSLRGVTVMYAGSNAARFYGDTWEWDGTQWTQRTPSTTPGYRSRHAMAYDSVRGITVMFGGEYGALLDDTWEWNGVSWTQLVPSSRPPARRFHAMAFDPARGVTVLFGGSPDFGSGLLGDTWEWDGAQWTERTPAASPPARLGHTLTYDPDRGRVVLFGGQGASGFLDDIWEWDGTRWQERFHEPGPPRRGFAAAAYVGTPGSLLAFGGWSDRGCLGDTWQYRGGKQIGLLFGGIPGGAYGDVWTWNGDAWASYGPPVIPPPRWGAAMVYDRARGVIVLFGGEATLGSGLLNDTWEWDGTDWTQRIPQTRPPARYHHAMAYDDSRGRVVLYGGEDPWGGYFADTWEWDGTEWEERTPPASPPARWGHAMAYDRSGGRTLLFGGVGGDLYGDTWEWDGTQWQEITPATSPAARAVHSMAYDARRQRVVLFGGGPQWDEPYADTWEWVGGKWVAVSAQASPPGRVWHSLAYDASRDQMFLFGGLSPADEDLDDMWLFRSDWREESCDGMDDDGNGLIDEGCDDDLDGFCDASKTLVGTPSACPNGGADCDDARASVSAGGEQICDGINNDCNDPGWPLPPPGEADADGDGSRLCGGDCDDANPARFPGNAEVCDGQDNDCDSVIPPDEIDGDGDGVRICANDCDDGNWFVWAPPVVVDGLDVNGGSGLYTFTWTDQAPASGFGTYYDVFEGRLGELLPGGDYSSGTCREENLSDAVFSYTGPDPLPGDALYFMLRAQNACPGGTGTYGTANRDTTAAMSQAPCN
ncbi:MAG TPA: kelch repeat-containing protein [Candidatus Saccharimonadales bacterium]|nr:kelch repeat-containing protein [Candidatus Saccharimonadales bacterium]